MIASLIAWFLSRRGLVAAFALALLVAGALYVRSMPVDAIPDLSDLHPASNHLSQCLGV